MEIPGLFQDPRVEKMVKNAVSRPWNVYLDLPWDSHVNLASLAPEGSFSLLTEIPEFKKLSESQKVEVRYKEVGYHLSNLLAGEHQAIVLAGQLLAESPSTSQDWTYFLGTLLNDELNHSLALSRYLNEKFGFCYEPHPRIQKILATLASEADFASKLFVGQIVLEWTAASLLTSMVIRTPEPLINQIVRRVLMDESRHLGFSKIASADLAAMSKLRKTSARQAEDLLFEGIVACVASLCAIPIWKEMNFSQASCSQFAMEQLRVQGVLKFYKSILPCELKKYGLYTERLDLLLQQELEKQVISAHWDYEPVQSKRG